MDFKTFIVWLGGFVCVGILGILYLILRFAEKQHNSEKKVNQ